MTSAADILTLAESRGATLALAPDGAAVRVYFDVDRVSGHEKDAAMAELRPLLVANKPAIVAHLAEARRSWQESIEQAAATSSVASPAILWLIDLMSVPGRLEAAAGEQEALLDKPRGERQVRKGYFVANEPRWWPMWATVRQVWQGLVASTPGTAERRKAIAAAEWLWRLWRGETVAEGGAIGWRASADNYPTVA